MRSKRNDHPGAWWHVTNRGLAKRPVFETAQDVQRFCAAISAVVESGLLEVHAYSFLTTHYHLLVRSPTGRISDGMCRIANPFVRWFNRSRRRDGPLFRARFTGRRVDDWVHWECALRYIDLNPVRAGMCELPSDHPHGSAHAHRRRDLPDWLSRNEVERTLCGFFDPQPYDPERYDEFAAACDPRANAHLVERLLRLQSAPAPKFADLVRAASSRQQSWMAWKQALADGTAPGTAFISPEAASSAADAASRLLRRKAAPERSDRARDLRVALLHHGAGLTMREVASSVALSATTVQRALRRHAQRLADNPAYEELVVRILRTAIRRTIPVPSHPLALPIRVNAGGDATAVGESRRPSWHQRHG